MYLAQTDQTDAEISSAPGALAPDLSLDSAVDLTRALVKINSANTSHGITPGPGEVPIARFITAWFHQRNIETHWIELTSGRPSVVAIARGSGGGKSLMFNGHLDTVTTASYLGDPLSGRIEDGKVYGRGSADMKGGLAAAMVALAAIKDLSLGGDVIFAGVADEEDGSIGTEQLLENGWRADAAIVSEPTDLDVVTAHKGFVTLEVNIKGVAAHRSRPELGVDAISKAGYFLVELDRYAQRLQQKTDDSAVGPPSVHASVIKGGDEICSYPALCTISLERRTVPGETAETVRQEVCGILEDLEKSVPGFQYDLKITSTRPSFEIPMEHPLVSLVSEVVGDYLGGKPCLRGERFWTDAALLAAAGIPTLLLGPRGEGLHGTTEWVDADSVHALAGLLTTIAVRFCR
ncbi:acetylornithine deacetylase [Thozetella sp. PMI_491]|nr:acetylornithine deacetylase [Thozetella sp. PMI_491]